MVMFDIRGNELFLCIFFAKNHGTDLVQNIYCTENVRTIKYFTKINFHKLLTW